MKKLVVLLIETLLDFIGDCNRTVDLATYSKAIYILQINTKNAMVNGKLNLQK